MSTGGEQLGLGVLTADDSIGGARVALQRRGGMNDDWQWVAWKRGEARGEKKGKRERKKNLLHVVATGWGKEKLNELWLGLFIGVFEQIFNFSKFKIWPHFSIFSNLVPIQVSEISNVPQLFRFLNLPQF